MQAVAAGNSKLPFKCRMVCISLIVGSLMLVLVYIVYYLGLISTETAIWAAAIVFILAALYESFLLSLITRHMLNSVKSHNYRVGPR